MAYEVLDAERVVYLRACSRMVQLDAASGAPRAFTADERAAFEAFPGEGPVLHEW
jgi:acyl-CoA thioester hydrolase